MANFQRQSIKEGKLIYHLTSLDNLKSIIEKGLLPRNELEDFVDVANPEIINFREDHDINDLVPFHFFAKNPFDGRVQQDEPDKEFILICLNRSYASENDFRIIPMHPKAMDDLIIYNYEEGFEQVDWETMDKREYQDDHCKHVCMAECLSTVGIQPKDFSRIFVRTEDVEKQVRSIVIEYYKNPPFKITVNKNMFVGRSHD